MPTTGSVTVIGPFTLTVGYRPDFLQYYTKQGESLHAGLWGMNAPAATKFDDFNWCLRLQSVQDHLSCRAISLIFLLHVVIECFVVALTPSPTTCFRPPERLGFRADCSVHSGLSAARVECRQES